MMTSRSRTAFRYSLVFALSLLCCLVLLNKKAMAMDASNTTYIPTDIQSHNSSNTALWQNYYCMNPVDGVVYGFANHSWISKASDLTFNLSGRGDGSPTATFINDLPAGADTYNLRFNVIGNHCTSNMTNPNPVGDPWNLGPPQLGSQLIERDRAAYTYLHSINTAASSGVGTTGGNGEAAISWVGTRAANPNLDRYYATDIGSAVPGGYGFSLTGLSGLATGQYHTINVTLTYRPVAAWADGTFQCVNPPRQFIPDSNGAGCGGTTLVAAIRIWIPPATPEGFVDSANCSVMVGWAFDRDVPGQSLAIHFYNGATFVGAVIADQFSGNQSPPSDVNGAKNIPGRHRFTFTIPDSLKSTTGTPTITAYAIGIDSTGVPNGENPVIGSKTIGPCKSSACSLIQGSTNGGALSGNLGNNGVYTINSGESLSMKLTYFNSAPVAGGYTWTTGGGNQQVRIGTDGPYGPRNDFGGVIRINPDTPGASVPPLGTASYTWAHVVSEAPGDYTIKFQMVQEMVEWFAPNVYGNGSCQFTVRVGGPPPSITCTLNPVGPVQINTPYPPSVKIVHTGLAYSPPVTDLTAVFKVDGVQIGTYGGAGNTLARGATIDPATSSGPYSNSTPGLHTISVRVTGQPGINQDCTGDLSLPIANLPYLKVFGGDVSVGGGFQYGNLCASNAGSKIHAYAEPLGGTDYRGSSGQFGVTALMNINGFYSSSTSTRTAPNVPPIGATFSNSSGVGDPVYGGAFGGSGTCITDFYTTTQDSPTPIGNVNAAVAASLAGKSQYTASSLGGSGDLTIPKGHQIAVYVNGDIYIDRNIIYDTTARSTVDDIPYFALIVKGNIYIAPTVTNLDGIYIAQPASPGTPAPSPAPPYTDGRIYTCAKNTGSFTAAELYDNCSTQLVVNGALIAQQIKFMRTIYSLNQGISLEAPDNFSTGTGADLKAAEVINYTPEIYLAPSPLKDPNSSSSASGVERYDAIFSLPPVF